MQPIITIYRGLECTCGTGGRVSPELHAIDCTWRKAAEAERETYWDDRAYEERLKEDEAANG